MLYLPYPAAGVTMSNASEGFAHRRLWSLWDIMKRFSAHDSVDWFSWVMEQGTLSITEGLREQHTPVPETTRADVMRGLAEAQKLADEASLVETNSMIVRLTAHFSTNATYGNVRHGLAHLADLMRSEMSKVLFLSVSSEDASSFEQEQLFGAEVDKAFPSARNDIKEAGNCFACGRYMATIYHLMGVAEIGLRVLAWDRRVRPKHTKYPIPLEMAEWGQLVGGLETKIPLIQKWKRNLAKAEAEQFYNTALVEIRAFNKGWRTHTAHGRLKTPTHDDAKALFGHVERFMKTLAQKVSETERTPLIWKVKKV